MLPAVHAPGVTFAAGERLYVDVVARVSRPAKAVGDGVLLLDNAGPAASLTMPALVAPPIQGQPKPTPSGTPTTSPTPTSIIGCKSPSTTLSPYLSHFSHAIRPFSSPGITLLLLFLSFHAIVPAQSLVVVFGPVEETFWTASPRVVQS